MNVWYCIINSYFVVRIRYSFSISKVPFAIPQKNILRIHWTMFSLLITASLTIYRAMQCVYTHDTQSPPCYVSAGIIQCYCISIWTNIHLSQFPWRNPSELLLWQWGCHMDHTIELVPVKQVHVWRTFQTDKSHESTENYSYNKAK